MKCVLLLFLAAGLCAAAEPATVATLMALDEQFCRESAAKGVDGWMAWFADETIIFPASGSIIRSKAEAQEYYRKVFPPGKAFTLRWKPTGGMISGDMGFTYGTWENGGQTGKYLTNWKRQSDGSWKIVADVGNPDAPKK